MNTLRKYLDIITESNLFENPWEGKDPAKAQAWAKLSPQVQQKLGMADPTDNIIISRMVKGGFLSGQAVTDANPDGTVKTATPVATPTSAPATRGIGQQPTSAVNPALQPAPLKTPSAGASADGNAGELAAQANASAAPAQAGQPVNRDSMTFGQAFADARKGGEKTFTWKGKLYTTDIAAPKTPTAPSGIMAAPTATAPTATAPTAGASADGNAGEAEARAAMPAPTAGAPTASSLPPELASVTDKKQPYWVNGTRYEWKRANPSRPSSTGQGRWAITAQPNDKFQINATRRKTVAKYTGPDSEFGKQPPAQSAQPTPTQENVGYFEDQNLASIVHLAGLR